MMWKTHAAITKAIGDALDLEPDLIEVMVEASVEPDRCPVGVRKGRDGRWNRSLHHGTSRKVIMVLLWKARLAFLEGDVNGGSRALGLALHYVQDNSVPRCRNWKAHKDWERKLAGFEVPEDAIMNGIDAICSSPLFIEACVDSIRPRKDQHESIYSATALSAALAGSILHGLEPPCGMEHDIRRRSLFHGYVLPSLTIGIGAFSIITVWPFSTWLAIGLSVPTCAILAYSGSMRSRTRKLAEWYDIL